MIIHIPERAVYEHGGNIEQRVLKKGIGHLGGFPVNFGGGRFAVRAQIVRLLRSGS
jgi:hypothetical protein